MHFVIWDKHSDSVLRTQHTQSIDIELIQPNNWRCIDIKRSCNSILGYTIVQKPAVFMLINCFSVILSLPSMVILMRFGKFTLCFSNSILNQRPCRTSRCLQAVNRQFSIQILENLSSEYIIVLWNIFFFFNWFLASRTTIQRLVICQYQCNIQWKMIKCLIYKHLSTWFWVRSIHSLFFRKLL